MSAPKLAKIVPEFTLARKKLNKFFQEEIDLSENIHFETDKMHGIIDDMDPQDFNDSTVYESNS